MILTPSKSDKLVRAAISCLAAIVLVALVASVAACDKKADGAGGTSTSGAVTTGAKGKTSLKLADVQTAYDAEFGFAKMKDPMDKKVAAFVAKIGKPESDSGKTKVWHAIDGANCDKVELDSDGAMRQTQTDKSACGL